MDTTEIQAAIKTVEGLPLTTFTARLRLLLPTIEVKAASGVRHEDIVAALNDAGMQISVATYKVILKRLRRQARERPPDYPARVMAPPPAQAIPPPDSSIDPRAQREQIARAFIPDTPTNKFAARITNTQEKKS